ncbi:Cytoplasmic dynein 2 light intermediate chain 1 [Aphelenchoides fujianensis]|nr:Cytoplasmic dynein 2 light intermediate chain 1 [Aphelenchoides fujianensis]
MTVDIFQIGVERLKKERAEREQNETSGQTLQASAEFNRVLDVVVCGSLKSGKSTFINRFLDRNQSPEPTFGLCYKFATRTRVNSKELANIWELGNAGLVAPLLQNCLNEKNISAVSVVLFLDLSKPETFEATLRPLIDVIRRQIEDAKVKVANTSTFTLANNAPDGCFAIGIPMAVVGGHYDEFQNFDTEKKKSIVKLLRFLASHQRRMYSIYQEPLIARGKGLLNQFGFDAPPNKTAAVDVHKPVFVPAFTDTLEEIGLTGAGRSTAAVDSHRNAMEVFYAALGEQFKQEPDSQTPVQNADDELRQFAEPQLDAAIEERYRELEFIAREQRARNPTN